MKKLFLVGAGAFAATVVTAPAEAAYTITFLEVGSNVVATGTGSLNVTGLTSYGNDGSTAFISPGRNAALIGGGTPFLYQVAGTYQGSLGTGTGLIDASSSTGAIVGQFGGLNLLAAPRGYVSGTTVTGTSTFANSSFQSLGLVRGTLVYSFNSGANADTITYQIGAVIAPVPEPASWAMMIGGFGLIGGSLRRRAKVRTTVSYA